MTQLMKFPIFLELKMLPHASHSHLQRHFREIKHLVSLHFWCHWPAVMICFKILESLLIRYRSIYTEMHHHH